MDIKNTQTHAVLAGFVILVTALSICGIDSLGKVPAHAAEAAPIASSCMLDPCETLTSKNLSASGALAGFSFLLGPALIPLLFHLHQVRGAIPRRFSSTKNPSR